MNLQAVFGFGPCPGLWARLGSHTAEGVRLLGLPQSLTSATRILLDLSDIFAWLSAVVRLRRESCSGDTFFAVHQIGGTAVSVSRLGLSLLILWLR